MHAHNALPLDDDILDRIMTSFATIHTFRSAILISKAFYRVFQTPRRRRGQASPRYFGLACLA
ncbi:hypothetical protein K438DRAFT_1833633 [Mycena galopus ATCC 62051]|nr:hypothetical protein K438DRAFT_1833633 [Mycena galopus ATCC 62051]